MIPVFTLSRQNKLLAFEYNKTIAKVIDKSIFILGNYVNIFEQDFAHYLKVHYAVGVASGTDAISLALKSVGVSSGDEVIMPANSYPTVFGVASVGAKPVLVDIDRESFNIDSRKIEDAITKKTKAIVAVHLYGRPANLADILQIAKKHNLKLIEDCAQAHGAEIRIKNHESRLLGGQAGIMNPASSAGRQEWGKVGTIGDVGCFSFYPTKNLGCFGDGGMVVTGNTEVFSKLKLLRMYGEESRYKSVIVGHNSRLDALQAAILSVKLNYLDQWNKRRREIAKLYESRLVGGQARIILPMEELEYAKHVFHLYVIRAARRDELKEYLEKKGIGTAIHFPKPIHLQLSFKYLSYKKGDFPESERAANEILSLPMFPEMTDREVEIVSGHINEFYG